MVDAVVSFVVDRLGDLLIEQVVFLRGVRDDVEELKGQLGYMLCFLKDAEKRQDADNRMRKWISDIRDVAYDAEDIIDNFILKVEAGTTKKMGLKDCFQKYFCICSKNASLIQQAKNLYGIGGEIETLKTKLTQIKQNQVDWGIKSIDNAGEGSDRMNAVDNWLRKERPYKDDEHVVGFKEDTEKLMSELNKEVKDRYVISIVGTGGLGKTTLARKLYNTLLPTKKFDCYAWVSVSTDYEIPDLLRSVIKNLEKPTTKEELEFLEKMKEDDLELHLREKTLKGHRYLMVLDDVWDVNVWPSLKRAFPDEKNGSRVIMTTRKKEVAEPCNERTHIHELSFLKDEESFELFCSKAFPHHDEVGNTKIHCPPNLKSLAKETANKCHGLPLAIVVLGGLLQRKDPDEWPELIEYMWRHVRDHDSHRVDHILASSFNDLPHRLKSCFLYLGLFPEDFEIDAQKLCRLWVAEGFIKLGVKKSFEEVAEAYLRELIDRSLIQVAVRNWRRIIKCRVHDLLRDFAIEKSKELNFLHIYEGTVSPNSRRLACYSGLQKFVSLDYSDMHLRTLLFFSLVNEEPEIAQLQSLCRQLRLLRVLDIGEHPSTRNYRGKENRRLPDEIWRLIHLRYLGLSGTKINAVSEFIGNLHALQTLELETFVDPIQLPDEICKAKQLRHLIGRFKWPFRVDKLENLRTLRTVHVEGQMEFNPMDLINLVELVVYVHENNYSFTLDSISGLTSLQNLEIFVSDDYTDGYPEVHLHLLSRCQQLLQLRLDGWGRWKLATEVLRNLKYLYLDLVKVTEDPMPVLEKLPKLRVVALTNYPFEKMVCSDGGFPQLEILYLTSKYLMEIRVEGGGMPELKGLNLFTAHFVNHVSMPDRLRSVLSPSPLLGWSEWAY